MFILSKSMIIPKTMFTNLSKLHRLALYKRYSCAADHETLVPENESVWATLNNGIRVATEQTGSPLACVSLFIQTGPRYELPRHNGINHFIEHMAFKGTTSLSKSCLEAFALQTGSRLDAKTTHEYQRFSVTCIPEYIQVATGLLCGIVCQLLMDPVEMERERESICLEMIDADRNYKKLVFENLIQTAFQGTSLGQKVVGSSRNIASFDTASSLAYMASQYQPWRLVFSTVGPVTNGYMVGTVNGSLGCMAATQECSDRGATRYTGSSVIYRDDSRDFTYAAVAFEAPGFLSKDYLSMLVLKHIIGSWNKSFSVIGAWPELAMRCTDTELCKSFESFYITFGDVGLWGVYFVCGKMDSEDFIQNWQDVIKSMSCMLRKSDVDRAKRATLLELCRERNGVFNSSASMGKEILYRCMRPTIAEYAQALQLLEPSELQELAYNTIYNHQPVVSAAGATESLPDYTRLAASQYWIRW